MSTYPGVSLSEVSAPGSVLTAYNLGSRLKSVDVRAGVQYAVSERPTVHVRAGSHRLVDAAAESPIVVLGDKEQFSVGVGLSRKFAFDLIK